MDTKSTNIVEIVPITLRKHPNADSLSIVDVFDKGFQVVVRTEDWVNKTIGAYIPSDSIMPDLPEYAFLAGHLRIKARRFRGEWSMGMLIDAPPGSKIGDDITNKLHITHYEPKVTYASVGQGRKTSIWTLLLHHKYHIAWSAFLKLIFKPKVFRPLPTPPEYDVDTLRRYKNAFKDGEPIYVTEKIHGTNSRYVFSKNRMYVGTHHRWLHKDTEDTWHDKKEKQNIYSHALTIVPGIEKLCRQHPRWTIYGEIYNVQKRFTYGLPANEIGFAAFDILTDKREWLNAMEFIHLCKIYQIPTVPYLLIDFPYNFNKLAEITNDLKSIMPNTTHIAEGIIIKPKKDRFEHNIGRLQLKLINLNYLESDKTEKTP